MAVKQAIIFRRDLPMSAGKMVAQGCHASVEACEVAPTFRLRSWRRTGLTKVVLSVPNEADLHTLHEKAVAMDLPCALIRDQGRTEVTPGSVTALAIGPGEIDTLTGSLPLWRDQPEVDNDNLSPNFDAAAESSDG